MQLVGVHFEDLMSIDIRLEGKWCSSPSRDWQGTVIADQPIVAITFLLATGICEWCKSERDQQPPTVRLALFPYDREGLDVQVNFSVGGAGLRWRTVVPAASYRPSIADRVVLRTAQIYNFTTVEGTPPIQLCVLFIAKADVSSSRKTLWRVRKKLEHNLPEPYRHWLTHARSGSLGMK
jgi:hypothetical protein